MSLGTEHRNDLLPQQGGGSTFSAVVSHAAQQVNTAESATANAFSMTLDEFVAAPELAVDQRELPKVPRSLGSISFSDFVMPTQFLRKQLRFARTPTPESYVSENALKQMLTYIVPHGFSLRTEYKKKKYATYALRALTYLAKHNVDLPFKEAIELLEAQLKRALDNHDLAKHVDATFEAQADTLKLFKHINYIMLALAYFIIHGQATPTAEITDYFIRGIDLLSMLTPAEYYHETLMVALTAKTKLPQAQPLSNEELDIIKAALRPIPVSRPIEDTVKTIKRRHGNERVWFDMFEKPQLRHIKKLLNNSKPLSKDQLTLILRRAKDAGRNHVRAKAMQLIRLAIAKRVDFPDKNVLMDVLNIRLKDDEFKIRANAVIATKMLLEDRDFQLQRDKWTNLHALDNSIKDALGRRQKQALKALKSHLNMHFSQALQDKDAWIQIIDELIQRATSEDHKLVALASAVKAQLVGDLSADNIKDHINQARDGQQLSDRVVQNLEQALRHKPTTLDKDHLYKCWLILSYAAGNGQAISMETVVYAASQYVASESIDLQMVLFNLLGYSLKHHGDSIITQPLLTKLLSGLDSPALVVSGYFFIDAWISSLQRIDNQQQFLPIMERLALPFFNHSDDAQLKYTTLLIFGKAAMRGVVFSPLLTMILIDELEKTTNKNITLLLITTIGMTLENITFKVIFSDLLVERLINLCLSKDTKAAKDALQLLLLYIPRAEQLLSPSMIQKVLELSLIDKHRQVAMRIIDQLRTCHYSFDPAVEAQLYRETPVQSYPYIYQLSSLPTIFAASQQPSVSDRQHAMASSNDRGVIPKSLAELIDETRALNQTGLEHNQKLKNLLQGDDIAFLIHSAHECYLGLTSSTLHSGFDALLAIKDWPEQKIKTWAKHVSSRYKRRELTDNDLLIEVLAVLIRTCELGHKKPRDVQLLALLIDLRGKEDKRPLLMEIATGQGKSLLNTMQSMIDGLFKEEVDNETSSEVLASRDAKLFSTCYELWNITTACNEDENHKPGVKDCYKKSVIYSDSNHLQFDVLRHMHKQWGTRGNRRFRRLNIDEVDSVTLIENTKFAMLGEKTPNMEVTTFILMCIWQKLCDLNSEHQEKKNTMSQEAFVNCILKNLASYVKDQLYGDKATIKVPRHLQRFVQDQVDVWVASAIEVYYDFKRNVHYTVETEDKKIIIVPTNLDTGVRQRGMSLNDGVQQFLQIKEGLAVDTITLMMNASTNRGHIGLYDGNVVGTSATLGGQAFRELISSTYNADIVNIPQFASNRLKILPGELKKNTDEWAEAIIAKAIAEASKKHGNGRVVIVTCKTIEKTQFLYDKLRQRFNKGRVIKYDDNRGGQDQFLEEEHDGNTIVVATMLAGRGMDLKISAEVCRREGTFELATFLAEDPHTEGQMFGRAGRCGEPGSAQVIANWEDIKEQFGLTDSDYATYKDDFNKLIELRNAQMDLKLEYIKQYEMPWIKNTNDIFDAYLRLKNELNIIDKRDKAKHYFGSFYEETKIKIKRLAVEERFGIWFQLCKAETKDNQTLMEEFEVFKNDILFAYDKDVIKPETTTLIQNPAHYIQLGHALFDHADFLMLKLNSIKLYGQAIGAYKAASKVDPLFAYQAYYHRALAIIELGKENFANFARNNYEQRRLERPEKKLRKNYKKQAMAKLSKAKNILETLLAQYKPEILESLKLTNPKLFNQIEAEVKSKKILLLSVNNAINTIKATQRHMSVELTSHDESRCVDHVGKKTILSRIETADEHSISLRFHDFKTYEDLTTNSQLENSLDNVPKDAVMKISFDSERFDDGITQCRLLLPINRSYKHNKKDEKPDEQVKTVAAVEQAQNPQSETAPKASDPLHPIVFKTTSLRDDASDMVRKQLTASPDAQAEVELAQAQAEDKLLQAQAAETQARQSMPAEAELLGLSDYWDYFTNKCMDGMMAGAEWTAEKLEAIRTRFNEFKDWLRDNHLYEEMEVSLTVKKLNIAQFKSLLETIANDYKMIDVSKLTVVLTSVEPSLLAWLVQHQYSFHSTYQEAKLASPTENETTFEQLKHVRIKFNSPDQLKTLRLYLSSKENKAFAVQPCIALDIDKIAQQDADKLMENIRSPIELHFIPPDKKYAKGLIDLATAQQQHACLTVSGLKRAEATKLVSDVDRTKQKLETNVKSIDEVLEKIGMSDEQRQDKQLNGYHRLYDIKEQNPMPWKSLALLTGMLVLETGACVALFTLTAGIGANFGLAFAGEALGDFMSIIDVLSSREFDVGNFAFKKALGMALNFSTAGLMPCTKAAQAAMPLKNITKTLIRVSPTHTITFNAKLLKAVGFHYAEKMIRSVAQQGVGFAGKGIVTAIRPKVKKWLAAELGILFQRSHMTQKLNRIFAYRDCLSRMGYYTSFYLQVHAMMAERRFKEGGLALKNADNREAFYQNFLEVIEQHEQKFSNFMTLLQNDIKFPDGSAAVACDWLARHGLLDKDNFELRWNPDLLTSQGRGNSDIAPYDMEALQQLGNCPEGLKPYKQNLLEIYANYASCLRHDYTQERTELIDGTIDRMSTHLMRGVENTVAFGGWVINQAIGTGLKCASRAIKGVTDIDFAEVDDTDIVYELTNLGVEVAEGTFKFTYYKKFNQFMERHTAENYRTQQHYAEKQNEMYNFLFRAIETNIKNLLSLLIIHADSKKLKDHQQSKGVINVFELREKIISKASINKNYSFERIVAVLHESGFGDIDDDYAKKLTSMLKQSVEDLVKLKREEMKMGKETVEDLNLDKATEYFSTSSRTDMSSGLMQLTRTGQLNPGELAGFLCLSGFMQAGMGFIEIIKKNAEARAAADLGMIQMGLKAIDKLAAMSAVTEYAQKTNAKVMKRVANSLELSAEIIRDCSIFLKKFVQSANKIESNIFKYKELFNDALNKYNEIANHLRLEIENLNNRNRLYDDEIDSLDNEIRNLLKSITNGSDLSPTQRELLQSYKDEKIKIDKRIAANKDRINSFELRINNEEEKYKEEIAYIRKDCEQSNLAAEKRFARSEKNLTRVIVRQCKAVETMSSDLKDILKEAAHQTELFLEYQNNLNGTIRFAMENVRRSRREATKEQKMLFNKFEKASEGANRLLGVADTPPPNKADLPDAAPKEGTMPAKSSQAPLLIEQSKTKKGQAKKQTEAVVKPSSPSYKTDELIKLSKKKSALFTPKGQSLSDSESASDSDLDTYSSSDSDNEEVVGSSRRPTPSSSSSR